MNRKEKISYKGFTLIELMIGVSILAILAIVGMTTYTQSQVRGRDLKRKQDLRAIAVALESYYTQYQHYPCVPNTENGNSGFLKSDNTSGANGFWIQDKVVSGGPAYCGTHPFNQKHIAQLPLDPIKNGGTPYINNGTFGYAYFGGSINVANCIMTNGQFYALVATLENPNDPDANSKKNYTWCGGGSLSTWNPNAFVIVSQ